MRRVDHPVASAALWVITTATSPIGQDMVPTTAAISALSRRIGRSQYAVPILQCLTRTRRLIVASSTTWPAASAPTLGELISSGC